MATTTVPAPDVQSSLSPSIRFQASPDDAVISLVLNGSTFDEILNEFAGDESSSVAATAAFERYRERIAALESGTRRAMDRAGLQRLLELEAELAPSRSPERIRELGDRQRILRPQLEAETAEQANNPLWEEAKEVRMRVLRAARDGALAGEAARRDLLHEIGTACGLDELNGSRLERLTLRRMLEPQRSGHMEDFTSPVDFLSLVSEATHATHELSGLEAEQQNLLATIILDYEARLHSFLTAQLERRLAPIDREAPIVIASDEPEYDKREREIAAQWSSRHDISAAGMKSVLILLDDVGEESRKSAWQGRYYRALCPSLMAARLPDELLDWLVERNDATDEQFEQAALLLEEYRASRDRLIDAAVLAGIGVKRRQIFPVHGASREQETYGRALWALHDLSRSTILRFSTLLSPEQKAALQSRLPSGPLDSSSVILCGPRIDSTTRMTLGIRDQYVEPLTLR